MNVTSNTRRSVLSPSERFSEIVFGLIMALSITGSLSVATAGSGAVREMLAMALGCNVAWGIVDAVMYVLGQVFSRRRSQALVRAVSSAASPEAGRAVLAEVLPPAFASSLTPDELESVRRKVVHGRHSAAGPAVTRDDLTGALGVFLLVTLATLPPTLPFLFIGDVGLALRVSHGVALVALFLAGAGMGQYAGMNRWVTGVSMLALGAGLVGVVVALGG